jgi:arginyl-tRNA synthetase
MVADRDIPSEEKRETARKIAFWAMKFGMLLQDSEKKIIFDQQTALSFEWETWPYLQYTTARMSSILRKNQRELDWNVEYSLFNTDEEKALLLKLASFEEEVQRASNEYKPNYVARWCLDVAQLFNSYYHNHKIIDDSNLELSKARLHLLQSILQVMKNALNLLWIDAVESM